MSSVPWSSTRYVIAGLCTAMYIVVLAGALWYFPQALKADESGNDPSSGQENSIQFLREAPCWPIGSGTLGPVSIIPTFMPDSGVSCGDVSIPDSCQNYPSVNITFSSLPSNSTPNSILLQTMECDQGTPTSMMLTETGTGTRIYMSDDLSVTLTVTGTHVYTPGVINELDVQIQGGFPSVNAVLHQMVADDCFFGSLADGSGQPLTIGDITPEDPGTCGEGVFYVQVTGPTGDGPITVNLDQDSSVTQVLAYKTSPGTFLTGPLVLVDNSDDDGGNDSYSGIFTVYSADSSYSDTLSANVGGGAGANAKVVKPTQVAHSLRTNCLWGVPGNHADKVEKSLITLGWTVKKHRSFPFSQLKKVPRRQGWYHLAHGFTQLEDIPPFLAFDVWEKGGWIFCGGFKEVYPADIIDLCNVNVI